MSRKNTGFTLVEILIVVIILGILAAIVIPQFTEASNDARVSAMVSDLQTVRSQIELYKVQHLDCHPGTDAAGAWTMPNFKLQLMGKTDSKGNIGTTTDFPLGPYLQKFPTNPFNNSDTVIEATGVADPTAQADATNGWWFNHTTGNFGVNSTTYIAK
jgi:general secretion pathway protein G